MNSLKEVYQNLQEQDQVKLAQAQAVERHGPALAEAPPELIKQAEDYDTVGRIMAHNVFADLVKEAMDEAMPYASEDDKKKEADKVIAKAKGEKTEDEDEDEKKEKEKQGEGEGAEKKAAIKIAVLQRMQQDPEYVAHLLSKYDIG